MKPKEIFRGVGKEPLLLHHGYLIAGEREAVLSDVMAFLGTIRAFELRGNPDLHVARFDTLSVDEARTLKEIASRKALGIRKVIILAFNAATSEAQNSLLKLLEEPAEHTHFFVIVPRTDIVLPTVRSRLFIADGSASATSLSRERAEEFLKALPAQRLKLAKEIADEISEGELEKQFAVDVVGSLEEILFEKRNMKNIHVEVFEDLALCRKYLTDPSASVKMLLEHLSLVLPTAER